MGHVVRETDDEIMIFGGGDGRYDIPKSEIMFVSGNVLIYLPMYEIAKGIRLVGKNRFQQEKRKKTLGRNWGMSIWRVIRESIRNHYLTKMLGLTTKIMGGHLVKETDDKIVVLGH